MRLRSTGLGSTEVEAELVSVKNVGDLIIFFANTTKPVKWRTRMGFQEKDIRDLVFNMMKPKNMLFILKSLISPNKEVAKTDF